MESRNVFVIALDAFNSAMLERMRGHEDLRFHSLLDLEEARAAPRVGSAAAAATNRLR